MSTSVSIPRETLIELVQAYIIKEKEIETKRIASYDTDLAAWQAQIAKEAEKIMQAAKAGSLKSDYASNSYTIRTKISSPVSSKRYNSTIDSAKKHLKMLQSSDQAKITVSDNNDWGRYL
jgi:hypothetical protein